ncbi:transglycosylase SLT domain-containing protein [Desulfoprunum benzoelyticum]|uniref:Membrane-bound lytic murein transglycosylase D n=1 Tax=Desulfoprunum benzoelyticum TaxID=1506996 RepID=A0A840UN25_9BACT|nr:lytic transglycosylase domain-containing protein [Desulfoprunum benzoelyticum]MBB5347667.1 membrane-bound lytic murein transglycosylase D [Desulfoprunum benzoelyticum]MBM9529205.1 transglycosylase SLT domain-containing protein [Desulfoprunum benzoelyticum]
MKKSNPTVGTSVAHLFQGLFFIMLGMIVCIPLNAHASSGNTHFPLYPAIQDNVTFWKSIYSRYSLNTAVIHDQNDLSIIYEVVTKIDDSVPGAGKANKLLIERKKRHYSAILRKLSRTAPATAEERRITAMFSGSNRQQRMAAAAESIRSQTGQRERFLAGVIRSGAYLPTIKQVLRSYGLPEDLAYLPHVESSFNTEAYSKVGASGIWQFTKSTGKSYLRIDQAVDERSDPIIAAHAAAKYLKNSYSQLGTWPLALTSYNYGTAGMKRALNEKGSYERIFAEYDKGYFKFASRNFYSEFLAALQCAKELERKPGVRLDQPLPTRTVTLKASADIRQIRKHFGVSQRNLERLNPALRSEVLTGKRQVPKGYALRLPAPASAVTPIIAAKGKSSNGSALTTRDTVHQVRRGETLTAIAGKYGTSTQELARINGLDSSVIRIGQKLRITDQPGTLQTATVAAPVKIHAATTKLTGSRSRLAVHKTTIHEGKRYGKIQVQPGESLNLLAKWTATPTTKLQRLNNLGQGGRINAGRDLVLVFDKVSVNHFHQKRQQFHLKSKADDLTSVNPAG